MIFGESYYNEWLGPVYRILIDKEEVGAVRYEEGEDEVWVDVLSFECGYKQFENFAEAVDILKSMFPGKKLTGLAGPIGCYCGDPEYWRELGALTYPDPDDDIFTVFELENKEA
jgi:hypothetical protein